MSFFKTLLAVILGVFISTALTMAVLMSIVVGLITSATTHEKTVIPSNSVLKIEPSSAIPEYGGDDPFDQLLSKSGPLTLRGYLENIDRAKSDDNIRGLWLKLGGYTGSWAQAEELRGKIAEFKKSGKFVYATSDEHGYDEINYYLATAADSVILNPAAGMEINGIFLAATFFKPMLDRIGVKPQVVRAGAFKSAVEPFLLDSASKESKLVFNDLVNSTFAKFRDAVETTRKISPEKLTDIIDNQSLLTSGEARQLGLIDGTMYEDEIVALLKHRTKRDSSVNAPVVEIDKYADAVSDDSEEDSTSSDNQIAIVYAVGTISSGESRFSANPLFGGETLGSDTFAEAMKSARDNSDVKAVVIRIDSPGGDASASEAMWREVVLTRAKKPVIVSMAGVAASGGYFIAAPADTIVAEPSTITGSIGVFGLWFSTKKLFEDKLGINVQVFKSNPNADMRSSAREATDKEIAIATKGIDSVYSTFKGIVAAGRHLSLDSVQSIAQGRVWTGEEAKAIGLVDEIGGLDRALEIAAARVHLKKNTYDIRVLPRQKGIMDQILDKLNTSAHAMLAGHTQIDDYKMMLDALNERSGIQMRMQDFSVR